MWKRWRSRMGRRLSEGFCISSCKIEMLNITTCASHPIIGRIVTVSETLSPSAFMSVLPKLQPSKALSVGL